jgi:uncharacterized protein
MFGRTVEAGSSRLLAAALVALTVGLTIPLGAAESPPAPPARYFNDYAGFVSPDAAERLDRKLEDFDKQTSNQIVVAIFPELPSPSLEDFTIRTAQAWRVGREKLDNGVILFVFVKDRALRLEVGYGLEGALPDAAANRIVEDVIVPAFREGHPESGLEAGIDAVMAATRGEYKPPPSPRPAKRRSEGSQVVGLLVVLALFILLSRLQSGAGWATYDRRGRRGGYWGGWGGGGWGGGGWGGGGSGGGFSGGGGSFGGGGASGRW